MSPLGGDRDAVGRSKVSGPLPATPSLPSVIKILRRGELEESPAHHHAGAFLADMAEHGFAVVDIAHPEVPLSSTVETVRIRKQSRPKAFKHTAGGSNSRIGGFASPRLMQVALPGGTTLKQR